MGRARTARPKDAPRHDGLLILATLGTVGAALLGLYAASEVTVAADGTLSEPFWALALGALAATAAGAIAVGLLFRLLFRRRRRWSTGRQGTG